MRVGALPAACPGIRKEIKIMEWKMLRFCGLLSLALVALGAVPANAEDVLTFDQPETAGICGFRALWDTPVITGDNGVRKLLDSVIKDSGLSAPWDLPSRDGGAKPGALAFDAIHRSLLVRFPGAAEKIAEQLRKGYAITKAELVLPWADTELWPWGNTNWAPPEGGYLYRANWGVDRMYRAVPAEWHAVAWALRRPWRADAAAGPTWNAWINGAGYWAHFGAQDDSADRFARRFGPTPVHHGHVEGRMDVTASLTDAAFGATLGERLRRLADCGFLLKKWETYDHRYYTGAYEWGTATGGRAIIIHPPKLVVTLAPAQAPKVELPPPADIAKLAETLRKEGTGGEPTAKMPDREELKRLAERLGTHQPAWMPQWQWQRVKQLLEMQYGAGAAEEPFWYQLVPGYIQDRYARMFEESPDGWRFNGKDAQAIYTAWVDQLLGKQYRGWYGFDAAQVLLPWYAYQQAMPGPVQEWFRNYWTAWLMPDRTTADSHRKRVDPNYVEGPLVHPMADDPRVGGKDAKNPDPANGRFDSYYAATGDWRGNKSFYRSGFNYTISTTNFNNTASMGALLGAGVIGSKLAAADGRHGQANFPLKLWTWFDGTTQEELDDYYFGITVKAQKMISDFAPTPADRLIGRSQLLKSMTMLAEDYHPGLRRFVAGASRTATHYRLGTQEGLYGVLHTLSPLGTYTDLAEPRSIPQGYEKFGHEFPTAEVARQAVVSPYAPLWYRHVIDEKPLPFQMTAAYKQWGGHSRFPMMRRMYLAENYGLYSINSGNGNIPIIAHWRREARQPETSRDIGTMFMRFGINTTRLVNDAPGWIRTYGSQAVLQHENKMIVSASPFPIGEAVSSVQATIAFFNYEKPEPSWEIYVDGRRVQPPCEARAGQRIIIRDGVTYIGIIPLPATDLGRNAEVVIHEGDEQTYYNRYKAKAALVIDNYNLRSDAPVEGIDKDALDRAYGGFVVEFGDASQYRSFDDFRSHMAAVTVKTSFDREKSLHRITCVSGDDTLEMAACTTWRENQKMNELFAWQRINGKYAYLPDGVERDSPFSVQARTGRLEKNGAILRCDAGRLALLQHEPVSGAFGAHNPLAELNHFSLQAPGGVELTADGRVGLCLTTFEPKANTITIDHAFIEGQAGEPDAATAFLVFGMPKAPTVILNGTKLEDPPRVKLGGREAIVVPLQADEAGAGDRPAVDLDGLAARYAAVQEALR